MASGWLPAHPAHPKSHASALTLDKPSTVAHSSTSAPQALYRHCRHIVALVSSKFMRSIITAAARSSRTLGVTTFVSHCPAALTCAAACVALLPNASAASTATSELRKPLAATSFQFAQQAQCYSQASMDGQGNASLSATLTPALLRHVREFWFEQLQTTEALILPSWENHQRWFLGGEAFDRACKDGFGSAVEAIHHSGVTSADDLLKACQPSEPLDWLSLVLLLDQMPRNCYRGEAAGTVFKFFDPLARGVVQAARTRGIPDTTPALRWRLAYRTWFYLPLMHSEDLALHEQATREYEAMQSDFDGLADGTSDAGEAQSPLTKDHGASRAEAQAVVRPRSEEARALVRRYTDYELRHANIIKQFGRYPHRNAALGRMPTTEETAYLAEGGETFGPKA